MSPEKERASRRLSASVGPSRPIPVAVGLRSALREGYGWKNFRADLLAGLVVGVVALPLSMALAIASGVPPQHGLYTAIIAGGLIAVTGGSRLNVSGPTAAFVVLLAPISAKYGVGGLAVASLMAGMVMVLLGFARMGRLIQFVPHPVTTGFTAGIAVVIATLQVKDFLGLSVTGSGEHYWNRIADLWAAMPSLQWADATVGALTLLVLIVWPKITKKIPGPLVAILLGTLAALALTSFMGAEVATIGSRFSYVLGARRGRAYRSFRRSPCCPGTCRAPTGSPWA
ncbi:MAG: SulP family inorganic anion transporter [Planctomycetota bacterium]|nr:SulP family inorganic anion transporter [Planctomycetota bacterium]